MNKLSKILIIISIIFTLTFISSCKKTYLVTYDADGGTFTEGGSMITEEYKKNTQIEITYSIPEKEGYEFTGWKIDGSGKLYTKGDTVKITEKIIFVATYEKVEETTYLVTFEEADGTVIEEKEVLEGETVSLLAGPKKEGYTFIGWKNYEGEMVTKDFVVTEDIFLVAVYEKIVVIEKEYKVTYQTGEGLFGDGTNELVEIYKAGLLVSLTTLVPEKEGYSFIGWYNAETDEVVTEDFEITKDITLVAKYGGIMYEIKYRAVAGEFSDGTNQKVVTVSAGSSFTYIEYPTNGDRLFNGWYDAQTDEFVAPGTIVTSDIEVKAKYKRPGAEHQIKLNLNGGITVESEVLTYYEGINYILPIPTKDGFEFLGWYESNDFSGNALFYQSEECEVDKEYYAKWKLVDKNYAKVIFDELVPETTSENLNLVTSYQGASLYFTSSNTSIITNKGIINPTHKQETVTITGQVSIDNEYFEYSRDVIVKAIVFDDMTNPIAGYFYATKITNQTEVTLEHLDIVYYAFAHVSEVGGVTVLSPSTLTSLMNDAVELRKEKDIRFVISIAGGAANFSAACRKIGYAKLADNIISIVKKYNMDGVDIDWEFPSDATDMEYMYQLCANIRLKLDLMADGTGSPYLVTAAIPSHASYAKFNLRKLNNVLDYINMMSYDMNLEGRTTHLCPLHKSIYDGSAYAVSYGIELFTRNGVDQNKIIIGAAFYGKSYKVLGDGSWKDLYPGLSAPSQYIALQYDSGTVTYKYIYRNILSNSNYVRYYDTVAKVPYLYSAIDQIFITYEDEESLIAKVDYAYENGLGVMFWEYGYDYENILTDAICNRVAEHKNGNIQ